MSTMVVGTHISLSYWSNTSSCSAPDSVRSKSTQVKRPLLHPHAPGVCNEPNNEDQKFTRKMYCGNVYRGRQVVGDELAAPGDDNSAILCLSTGIMEAATST